MIKGYTKLKILMPSTAGDILEMEAEAYVVKGMSVPILLGEDFQINYELGVTRNVELGTKITFKGSEFEVEATGVDRYAGIAQIHNLASSLTTHASRVGRAKEHRRAKTHRQRRKRRNGVEGRTVRAAEDFRIKAQETRVIRLDGDFRVDKTWLVESNFLATEDDSYFSVPKTLISARNPCVPVSNLSNRPRMVRKGEILGTLTDPEEFFDKPKNKRELDELRRKTALISTLIERQMDPNGMENKETELPIKAQPPDPLTCVRTDFGSGVLPSEENDAKGVYTRDVKGRIPDLRGEINEEEFEDYGPKTAAMPDNTDYPSEKLKELLDMGSLPENLKEKAWDMLGRRVKAFGFDGRLGHLDTQVKIRTKEDQDPIAVPMYSSSPEKRRVIDAQLDKWFEQGVIEPSVSPWSAPVVIAY
jgi:hypothetical protein